MENSRYNKTNSCDAKALVGNSIKDSNTSGDHHHRSWLFPGSNSMPINDDGSSLQVPGDDGSDQLAEGIEEGGVPMKPATVVACQLFKLASDCSSPTGGGILPRHREPGYHTIRKTLYRYQSSSSSRANSRTDRRKHDYGDRNTGSFGTSPNSNQRKRSKLEIRSDRSSAIGTMQESGEENSSGSGTDGTEDGYAGSVSSNETGARNQHGSASPSSSTTSSEECQERVAGRKGKRIRNNQDPIYFGAEEGKDSIYSSDIADYSSSGNSVTMFEEGERNSSSPSLSSASSSSSNCEDSVHSGGLEMCYLSAKREADAEHERICEKKSPRTKAISIEGSGENGISHTLQSNRRTRAVQNIDDGRPPVLTVGCDIMAHILTFLEPPSILDILTMPLSKLWRSSFTSQAELWRVLCLVDPFKAVIEDAAYASNCSGKDSYSSVQKMETEKRLLDKYRLLYTSFVRCMKYISQIRDDAVNGRPPTYIDYGISGTARSETGHTDSVGDVSKTTGRISSSPPPPPLTLGSNRNLQMFLAEARGVVVKSTNDNKKKDDASNVDKNIPRSSKIFSRLSTAARVATAINKTKHMENSKCETKNRPKFGRSMITSRLFGPSPGGEPGNTNLPWSCAIYSIVNWMVKFSDVEGIQTLCLKVLPTLLENEQHRLTAQSAGLADVVLRAMVMFTGSAQLHIAAFHTLVILARPHGGKEGMLFHNSMTADGIFGGKKSGIAVMLDSMRRFQDNDALLAMSCWALVNIALVSDQKTVLVKLGGIQAITNAMSRHPFSAELQFRALFALINLVIPSVEKANNNTVNVNSGNVVAAPSRQLVRGAYPGDVQDQLGDLNETTEREIIDELVGYITSLVVRVMKNFCSSEAIVNRACLVLHNLSLTDDYHATLLWTPQCYQMLEWCVANYKTDRVLQQSATGTLLRLQSTLSTNEAMRGSFFKSLRNQQQNDLEGRP